MRQISLATAMLFILALTIAAQETASNDASQPALDERQVASEVEQSKAEYSFYIRKYTVARRHAELAYSLDPSNKDSLLIIARSIDAQCRADDQSQPNIVRVREAIAAYQRVSTDPANDEIFNAVSRLYDLIGETELRYSWVMQRALCINLSPTTRAEAFVELAKLDLDSSVSIAKGIIARAYSQETDTIVLPVSDSGSIDEISQALEIASHGVEMARQAISLDQDNEFAWKLETDLQLCMAKLNEFNGNGERAAVCRKRAQTTITQREVLKAEREEAERMKSVTVECDTLCGRVVRVSTPKYPPIAKAARASGQVVVQLDIDAEGRVLAANTISGHPLLRAAAVQAAQQTTFSQGSANDRAVTIGSMIYTFTMP